jgi:NADPH2 dehydrogenase
VEYYAQRASFPGTLLVSEATPIAPQAGGYSNIPGIWNDKQIAGWKKVVDAVHAKGSFIYLQLWAMGRAAQPGVLEKEEGGPYDVVSSSDEPFEGGAKPRALSVEEIREYVGWYARAAKAFVEQAGGDGVESKFQATQRTSGGWQELTACVARSPRCERVPDRPVHSKHVQ